MPCLGFPFFAYAQGQGEYEPKYDARHGKDEQLPGEQLTESAAQEVGTLAKDESVETIDVQYGLAPEHQERYHP